MTVVVPDIPGATQADPLLTAVKVDVKAANTPATLLDQGEVSTLSPNNTGLPVNVPAIVQKAGGVSTGSVATLAQAFTNANVKGNSIIVVCACGNGTAMTVADSAGNTYTQALNAPNSTTFEAAIFYAVGILAGANTVTVTNAGTAASMAVEIYEVSGLITQAPLDQNSSGTGAATTGSTSALAPTSPNSLLFVGVAIGTGVVTAVTPGTGLVNDSGVAQPATPSGLFQFISLSGFLGSTAPITPSVTWTTSRASATAAAIFKPVVLGIAGIITQDGYNYTHVTTAQTGVQLKTGPGILHAVVVNTHAGSATLELDDALSHTNAIAVITSAAGLVPITLEYDVKFSTGLNITSVTTADWTIVWK